MGGYLMARVRGGMLEPLEPLRFPEGTLLALSISPVSRPEDIASRRAPGGWKGLLDADKLIEDIYAARLISTRPEPRL